MLNQSTRPDTIEKGTLTLVRADLDARPLFWTEDGQRFGYEPQVAAAVATQMGLDLRWHFCRWSDFASELHAGNADAIWCGCAITPERAEQFLFSVPYAVFHESVLVRSGDDIHSCHDLRGLRVGAIAVSTNMALAQQWEGCELVGFDGASDNVFKKMIDALRSDKIDAVVDDEPAFGGVSSATEFKIAFTVKTANRWGAAMRPESIEIKKAFDVAIEHVAGTGKLADIWMSNFAHIEYPRLELDSEL